MEVEMVMSKSNHPCGHCSSEPPAKQSGAVLYVALIMLILLSLLGIVGMQVTGLQERMSFNYRAANLAFQNAEQLVRVTECGVQDWVNDTGTEGCTSVVDAEACDQAFDPGDWAAGRASARTVKDVHIRSIGRCISGNTSLAMGEVVNDDPNPVYQITVYQTDQAENAVADAAIDTILRP